MFAEMCVKFFAALLGMVAVAGLLVAFLNRRQANDTEASYEDIHLAERLLVQWRVCKQACKSAINETQHTIKRLADHKQKAEEPI